MKYLVSTERAAKITPKKRKNKYIIFIDLKKGLDVVNRLLLIQKLTNRGFSPYIIRLIAHTLSHTKHHLQGDDETYFNNIGLPQGSTLSLFLFDLFIVDLLTALNDCTP